MRMYLIALLLISSLMSSAQTTYLELIKVTDSIYVFKPKIDWIHSNCTAIIGPDGIFIIDTFLQNNYAEEAIAQLKKISPLPVKYIFNTHGHADHVIGNSIFKAAYPQCQIIMNDSTFAKYPRNHAYGNNIKMHSESIPQLQKEINDGKTAGGYVLTEPLKEFWRWQLKESEEYIKTYKPTKPANGDIVFSEKLTIHFGRHDIVLMPARGEGHDTGDAIAWLPRKRIVVTGDIVVGPTPYAIRGRVNEMLTSLQQIIDLDPLVVIPGHGQVMQGLIYVKDEKELFSAVKQNTLDAISQGLSYREAVSKVEIPKELADKFIQGDDVKKWAMRAFFTVWTINGTYREKGLPTK